MKSISFEDLKDTLSELGADEKVLADCHQTYDTLRTVALTFNYFDMHIQVHRRNAQIAVTNTHLGSISDLAGRMVDIREQDHISSVEAAAHIVYQITIHDYDSTRYKDHLDDWDNI